ncbi:anthranilate phosphoribosyltransferase [Carboxydothermus ferrireducens]|uniref:Anthranilate phosphoribosyltransferase n=1 Tax=Carboxydothermus ferrireducens DSM 11255 TaxID=1119529 RepID=A0ABX2RB03_9THEO|nr:anthranilate phosphoribosyltransferase [Carboxydothermus ferrireducens]NYE58351.1 anthranilate phosphoribosyltransferase [Carboxydothermus ferrireducens DSM 11255]
MVREVLERLMRGENLNFSEALATMNELMEGKYTEAQVAAFLVALKMKGETEEEISAFALALREKARRVITQTEGLVDTCGTGGDGRQTFNISTAAAFVVAGAGIPVAKHGNRSVSSRSGSADVLEALGVNIDLDAQEVARCVDEIGIGFLFAPNLHPAMRHVAKTRREIGVRTVFNILGPLANPANIVGQVLGVFTPELQETLAKVLKNLGVERAFVVHGHGGLDEVSLTGPTRVFELNRGKIESYLFDPLSYGFSYCSLKDLQGGDAFENARLLQEILDGKPGPLRDVVLLNAAFGIMAGGINDFREALVMARESIDKGLAAEKLEKLRRLSHEIKEAG